jgi:hypothetical protein
MALGPLRRFALINESTPRRPTLRAGSSHCSKSSNERGPLHVALANTRCRRSSCAAGSRDPYVAHTIERQQHILWLRTHPISLLSLLFLRVQKLQQMQTFHEKGSEKRDRTPKGVRTAAAC